MKARDKKTNRTWYSVMLVFHLDSAKDISYHKRLRSMMLLKASSFEEARALAVEAGKMRAKKESITDTNGVPELRLSFCFVETLDGIGSEIEGHEVWSCIDEETQSLAVDAARLPTQTI